MKSLNKTYIVPVTEIAVQDLRLMKWDDWVSDIAEPSAMTTFRPHSATPGGSPIN